VFLSRFSICNLPFGYHKYGGIIRVILTGVVSFVSNLFRALHVLEVSMRERLEFLRLVLLICRAWIPYGIGYTKKMQKGLAGAGGVGVLEIR
jgi:hypothetical protein